ncbi:hypothetical protein CDL12_00532 [Handroanthus impetiginosus]|uniref:Clp R domain-containing protein n=1 Tax=Handroanthus impetiginosus TaxID=429701 RepID=A0A2G9IAC5_9LAMI|nr:hypothetical protein CDL12_00532 [Handroanthus impetiginosus]
MELSCSPPLSVNSGPVRRVCADRKLASFSPNCVLSSLYTTAPANACSSSSYSSFFGISLARHWDVYRSKSVHLKKSRGGFVVASGMFERFTERAIKAVVFSQREAKALGKNMVFTQHLLLGLVAEDRAPGGFLESGVTVDAAREAVRSLWPEEFENDESVENLPQSGALVTDVPFSPSTKRVFEAAVEYSRTMGHNFIAPEHIAIGLFTVDDGSAHRVLKRLGANVNHLTTAAASRLQGELAKEGREPAPTTSEMLHENTFPGKVTHASSLEREREKKALDLFCVDLTARASNGSIDPVIGRDTEVQRVIQILCRRTKCNPILLGEAGVGKTAIAEGLAIRSADGDVPFFLMKKRILSLDVGLLIAGAKERGDLEGRVTMLIREIKKSGNIILFIDEVHTLIGSGTIRRGNKGTGLDIANLLKPALGRGELQCIASTTMDEFRLHFEKDKALARRFQPVLINEPPWKGRRVSFKNALVVMTSNVGSAAIAKGRHNFGFLFSDDDDNSASYAGMKSLVMEELKGYFRPELLNRIDEVVVFRPLEKPQMIEILDIMLHEVKERLTSLGISLEVSDEIVDLICQQGYDRSYGARPLRRAVTQIIEDLVSESVLSGDCKPGDIAVIHVDDTGNPVVNIQSNQRIQLSDTISNL